MLRHERQHLQVYRDALATLEERIRAGAADKALFDAAIGAVTAVHAARAELDTGSRHARNAIACGGEISRLIRAGNPD